MTICIEDLGKKLVGKRIDGIDNENMNQEEEPNDHPTDN